MNQLPNPTLYSTVVKLAPTAAGHIPVTAGRLAHGAFLDLIRSVDPELSATLHAANQRRPFTVSPLRGLDRVRNGQQPIRQGQDIWLRFTLLSSELFATFTRYLLDPQLYRNGRNPAYPTLQIGDIPFMITEMLTTPGSHAWAGYATVEQLRQELATAAEQRAAALREIKIQFASPTVFSLGDDKDGLGKRMEPFPTPKLFFGSLASIWREVLPPDLTPKLVEEYVEKTVVVGLYKMQSRMVRFWGQPQIGAEGTVTYILRDKAHPQLTQLLNLLAELGFYSGVGAKTAMGMGQIRREA
jgi:CRISPR-associated endoribonuclease Cas6